MAEEHWLGLGWLRAVQTGVNVDFRGRMLAYVLTNCQADADDLRPGVPGPDRRDRERGRPAGAGHRARRRTRRSACATFRSPSSRLELWEAAQPATDLEVPQRHEIACISYTSGTTGPSKGVLVPWGRLWPNDCWIDMSADDVYYCPFPVFHLSGMLPLAWLGFPGGQVVLRDSFKTQFFWDDIRPSAARSPP